MSLAATPVRSLERRVADLYDFSLDIARYDGDVTFATGGGTIHYILDENILEMFVNPSENSQYVMRGEEHRPDDAAPTGRQIQAMQSALLTGEVLMSGALPGQNSRPCYLTSWHRWEALERVSHFIAHLGRQDPADLSVAMAEALGVKARLYDEEAISSAEMEADPLLDGDLRSLAERVGADASTTARFARVRAAAATLARDRRSEPIHQVNRILRADAVGFLAPATSLARREDGDDEEMAASAVRWAGRIRVEADARAARAGGRRTKGETAIWNDARSLALVEWLSRRLDPVSHRAVLVTGDQTMFDAYRRAYEENPEEGDAALGPFLLRRPIQYSTLFTSADTNISEIKRRIFYSLQQLVELPLTPIRMASVGSSKLSSDVVLRRHSLTLARLGRTTGRDTYFNDVWRAYGDRYLATQIDGVEEQIEETERLLNGLSGYLVERRIGEEHHTIIRQAGGDADERDRLISRYVEQAVDALIQAALAIWRPEAERFFRTAAHEGPKVAGRRVPLAVHLDTQGDGQGTDLTRMLDALLEDPIEEGSGGRPVTFRVGSSFDIFLGASAVALHANQWRLGDHFCEIAINAFRHLAKHEGTTNRDAAEAHYLCALAKRFRLGEIRVGDNFGPFAAATKLYERATSLLRSSEELAGEAGSGFASYRAYSERAALCLFYAVFCATQAERLGEIAQSQDLAGRAARAFRDAGVCLSEALKVERRGGFGRPVPDFHGSAVGRIRLQVLINIAAWHAIEPAIGPSQAPSGMGIDLARECTRSLPTLDRLVRKARGGLFEADILAFRISQGIGAEAARARLLTLRRSPGRDTLELDDTLFDLIRTQWGTALPRGPSP